MTDKKDKSFFSSLPGILTGVAAIITAVTGLYVVFKDNQHQAISTIPVIQQSSTNKSTSGQQEVVPKKGGYRSKLVDDEKQNPAQSPVTVRDTDSYKHKIPSKGSTPQRKSDASSRAEDNTVVFDNLRVLNTSEKIGNQSWKWTAFIIGPNQYLSKIRLVKYFLHPSFSPNVIEGDSSRPGHPMTATGWGTFELKAEVYLYNGGSHKYSLSLKFE